MKTCKHGHELVGKNAIKKLNGYIQCRTCLYESIKRYQARKRAGVVLTRGQQPKGKSPAYRWDMSPKPDPFDRPWQPAMIGPACGCCHVECCEGHPEKNEPVQG